MSHMLSPDNHDVIKIRFSQHQLRAKHVATKYHWFGNLNNCCFHKGDLPENFQLPEFSGITSCHHGNSSDGLIHTSLELLSSVFQPVMLLTIRHRSETVQGTHSPSHPNQTKLTAPGLHRIWIFNYGLSFFWSWFGYFFNCFSALKFLCCNDFSVSFSDFPRWHSKKLSLQLFMYDM